MNTVTVTTEEYLQLYSAMSWMKYHADTFTEMQLQYLATSKHHPDVKACAIAELEKRKAKLTEIIANVTNDIPA